MRYSLTSALLVFFTFAGIRPAHYFKNAGNANPLMIDVIIRMHLKIW